MNKYFLLASFLFASSYAVQSAELTAGAGIEFLAINGQKTQRLGENANKQLSLKEGNYQVVIRYEKNLKRGSKNFLFTSKPYVFDVNIEQNNLELSLPLLRNESQASAFFHAPKWKLKETNSNKVQEIVAEELKGSGFAAFSDIEKAIAYHNAEKNVGKVMPLISEDISSEEANNLTRLKHWYNKASLAEKKAFKHWMLDQDFE